jgi:hypothetical protein
MYYDNINELIIWRLIIFQFHFFKIDV